MLYMKDYVLPMFKRQQNYEFTLIYSRCGAWKYSKMYRQCCIISTKLRMIVLISLPSAKNIVELIAVTVELSTNNVCKQLMHYVLLE